MEVKFMNKKYMVLGTTILSLGAFAVNSSLAHAYKGDPAVKGPNYSEERHAQMEAGAGCGMGFRAQ